MFTLFKDNPPTGGVRGSQDTITTDNCTTAADGFCTIEDVLAGEYWVVETTIPAATTARPTSTSPSYRM